MRIISKYSDYYDAAMAYGQDQSLVYVRESKELCLKGQTATNAMEELALKLLAILPRDREIRQLKGDVDRVYLAPGVVVFAGKLFPYVRASACKKLGLSSPTMDNPWISGARLPSKVFYEETSLIEYFKGLGHDLKLPERSRGFFETERQSWDKFFELKNDTRFLDACVGLQLPVVEAHHTNSYAQMQVNPVLKGLEFYRCMDAWEAFQELSMFIGNLAQPDPGTVVISEKEKLAKHGMDEWSFRKMPEPRK